MSTDAPSSGGHSQYESRASSSAALSGQETALASNDDRVDTLQDPSTGLRVVSRMGPVDRITDPELLKRGIRAKMLLVESGSRKHKKELDEYRREARTFFKVGRVFVVLWVEAENQASANKYQLENNGGPFEKSSVSERHFVVVKDGNDYCSVIRVVNYGEAGVGKMGVKKSDHSIIHTTKSPPTPFEMERPRRDEKGMRQPIRVDSDDRTTALPYLSRLNYGEVYSIDHNIKLKPFGRVNSESREVLLGQFNKVWKNQPVAGPSKSATAPTQATASAYHTQRTDTMGRPGGPSSSTSTTSGNLAQAQARVDSGANVIENLTPQQIQQKRLELCTWAEERNFPLPPIIDNAKAQILSDNPSVCMQYFITLRSKYADLLNEDEDADEDEDSSDEQE